jgi:hypothetical protein
MTMKYSTNTSALRQQKTKLVTTGTCCANRTAGRPQACEKSGHKTFGCKGFIPEVAITLNANNGPGEKQNPKAEVTVD